MENVEINVRRNCFMPSENGVNYITVRGFEICKAATTWAPPAAYQDGMIGPHWAKGWIIEDCEQCGIVGRMGCVFSVIEDNHIHHINNMMQLAGAEIAGIKLHAAIDVVFRRNHIHHYTMGIWCDWEAQGTRITQNLLHDNHVPQGSLANPSGMMSEDIFVEVSHGPTLIDNNLLLSDTSLYLPTQGVAVVHNLILGAVNGVGIGTNHPGMESQPRYTPYHIPHRTEVAGFMTILHGDDRFYNNIFVQTYDPAKIIRKREMNGKVGTFVFDDFPTYDEWIAWFEMDKPFVDMNEKAVYHFSHLPVWAKGNVYLNGAIPWKKEQNTLTDDQKDVFVRLTGTDEHPILETNLYRLIENFTAESIDSAILGAAFEPEQRFENPDGSDLSLDRDYFDDPRGKTTIPGPFASAYFSNCLL